VPSLQYIGTGGFAVYCKITGMCSVLLCLYMQQPLAGSEEGYSQVMQNTENFFMFCCFCSQLGAGQGNTSL